VQELQVRLLDKEQKIEILEIEKQIIAEDLKNKVAELDKLRHAEMNSVDEVSTTNYRDDTLRINETPKSRRRTTKSNN